MSNASAGDDGGAVIEPPHDATIRAALNLLAFRAADRRHDIVDRTAWVASRARALRDDHLEHALALLAADSGLSARDLADALEGTQRLRTRSDYVAAAPSSSVVPTC